MLVALVTLFILISAVCEVLNVDRRVAGLFYSVEDGWPLRFVQPWHFLYAYGTIPGVVLTAVALFGVLFSWLRPNLAQWRRPMLLIFLTSVIGAGIMVNVVLKPYWGRPRPNQIVEFGGEWKYRSPCCPGIPGQGQSFPCGHCTMGFVFVPLFFLRRQNRTLAYAGGGFGVIYGIVLSVTRVVQGAHFVTDTMWSLFVLLLVSTSLYYFVLRIPWQQNSGPVVLTGKKRKAAKITTFVIFCLIVLGFASRRPVYETLRNPFTVLPGVRKVRIMANVDWQKKQVRFEKDALTRVLVHARGFGLPNRDYRVWNNWGRQDETMTLYFCIETKGYYTELNHMVEIVLPESLQGKVSVEYAKGECTVRDLKAVF